MNEQWQQQEESKIQNDNNQVTEKTYFQEKESNNINNNLQQNNTPQPVPEPVDEDFKENEREKINKQLYQQIENQAQIDNRSNSNQNTSQKTNAKKKVTLDDFEYLATLGKGAYGEVLLVKKKSSDQRYAMKVIDKVFLFKEKKQYQVYIEREVLLKLNSKYLVKLYYTFQDKQKLYFVLEYLEGGEFSEFLRIHRTFELKVIKFYIAEVVTIIEFLHKNGIAHRDLKPENLMLTQANHLKIIDFGTAFFFKADGVNQELIENIQKIKKDERDDQKKSTPTHETMVEDYQEKHKSTFVGTAEYCSPELLEDDECTASADIWALGCIIYKMFTGQTPFFDHTEYLIFQKIKQVNYSMPENMPAEAQDLLSKILLRNPKQRLGSGAPGSNLDFEHLKKHKFFEEIDFQTLFEQDAPLLEIASPYKKKKQQQQQQFQQQLQQLNMNTTINDNYSNNKGDTSSLSPTKKKPFQNNTTEFCIDNDFSNTVSIQRAEISQSNIIFKGQALKKCGWILYKVRNLILSDPPILSYYEPSTNQLKGQIELTKQTKVELKNDNKWTITTVIKTFYFKSKDHPAKQWVEQIHNLMRKYKLLQEEGSKN